FGKFALQAEIAGAVPERGTRDTGADMTAANASGLVFALDLIIEQVLRDDDVAFGTDDFGDVGDAPRTVTQALGLDDDVDRTHDHLADGLGRKVVAAHGDQRFQT